MLLFNSMDVYTVKVYAFVPAVFKRCFQYHAARLQFRLESPNASTPFWQADDMLHGRGFCLSSSRSANNVDKLWSCMLLDNIYYVYCLLSICGQKRVHIIMKSCMLPGEMYMMLLLWIYCLLSISGQKRVHVISNSTMSWINVCWCNVMFEFWLPLNYLNKLYYFNCLHLRTWIGCLWWYSNWGSTETIVPANGIPFEALFIGNMP